MRFASVQCSKMRLRSDPAGELTARSPDPLAGFKRGCRGMERARRERRSGRGQKGRGKGGEGSWNRAANWLRLALFRSYPYRKYNQLILVSFDSSECSVSENVWCGAVSGVHHVDKVKRIESTDGYYTCGSFIFRLTKRSNIIKYY